MEEDFSKGENAILCLGCGEIYGGKKFYSNLAVCPHCFRESYGNKELPNIKNETVGDVIYLRNKLEMEIDKFESYLKIRDLSGVDLLKRDECMLNKLSIIKEILKDEDFSKKQIKLNKADDVSSFSPA